MQQANFVGGQQIKSSRKKSKKVNKTEAGQGKARKKLLSEKEVKLPKIPSF